MAKFSYSAMNNRGKEVTGVVEAATTSEANVKIRGLGLFPTSIAEDRGSQRFGGLSLFGKKGARGRVSGKAKPKDLVLFTRQMSTLINSGVPLLRSLRIMREQVTSPAFAGLLEGIANAIEAGSTFSEALSMYPASFSTLFISMVKVGETGGVLDLVMKRLASFIEKSMELRKKVVSAMVYPSFVIFVAIGVVFFLVTFVIPKFATIFEDMDIQLPWLTRTMIAVSMFSKSYWYLFPIFPIVFLYGIKLARGNKSSKKQLDRWVLEVPLIGPLLKKLHIARLTRTLGTLLQSGVPLLLSLGIVKDTVGNLVIVDAIILIHDAVKEGEPVVAPLKRSNVFSPMVVSMVDIGEESGNLPEMLMKIADDYDADVDNTVGALTSILEPFLIIILAVIVGFIVIAMFLPMIQFITVLSK